MKLPDFSSDEQLNSLRHRMGTTSLGNFTGSSSGQILTVAELEALTTVGIDVPIDEVTVLPDGTLAYKDSRVLVYIRDVSVGSGRYDTIAHMPRFHLANCKTLQEMKQINRWGRYVVATRDDGVFSIKKIFRGGHVETANLGLIVCQNCLHALSFDGFSLERTKRVRQLAVKAFSIRKFFELFPKSFFVHVPGHDSNSAPINDYPRDFTQISARLKRERNWTCERCKILLRGDGDERFLHVHHKNAQRHDSGSGNLEVLCLGCHAAQPMHGHMKRLPEYLEFTSRFGAR